MIGCPEAEAAFLGCLLQQVHPFVTTGYLRQVEERDFTDPRHRAVHAAMAQLVEAGQAVDPITVLGQMRRSGLERAMTADRDAGVFLADLMAAPPSVGSAGHYLRITLEHRVRVEVEATGVRLQQLAQAADVDTVREVLRVDVAELARIVGRLTAREAADLEQVRV